MGGPGSGRKRSYEATPAKLPPMGETPETIGAYVEAVNIALCAGQLAPNIADLLLAGSRIKLNAVRTTLARDEDANLDRMLREAKAIHAKGVANEAADRHHATGRTPKREASPKVDPDGSQPGSGN